MGELKTLYDAKSTSRVFSQFDIIRLVGFTTLLLATTGRRNNVCAELYARGTKGFPANFTPSKHVFHMGSLFRHVLAAKHEGYIFPRETKRSSEIQYLEINGDGLTAIHAEYESTLLYVTLRLVRVTRACILNVIGK